MSGTWLAMALSIGGAIVATRSFGWGLACAIGLGLLQEPLRKIIPGQPAIIQLVFIPSLLMAVAWHIPILNHVRSMTDSWPVAAGLVAIISALAVAIIARFQNSDAWGALRLTAVAVVAPGTMLMGILAGRHWAFAFARCHYRVLSLFATGLFLFSLGIALEAAPNSYSWSAAIGPLDPQRPWYRTLGDDKFRMLSGFYRSPENAAFFSALLAVLGCSLAMLRASLLQRVALVGFATYGELACILTGRRKMQVMVWIAIALLIVSVVYVRQVFPRRLTAILLLVIAVPLAALSLASNFGMQLEYFGSSLGMAGERLYESTVETITDLSDQVPWGIGLGLGAMTPGVQYLKHDERLYAEGGLARVFAESGGLGLLLFLAGVLTILTVLFRRLPLKAEWQSFVLASTACSLLGGALLSFCIGHQVYGDPFITLILGFSLGMVLGLPELRNGVNP